MCPLKNNFASCQKNLAGALLLTAQQNASNRGKQANNTSGYKGVFFLRDHKRAKPWAASLKFCGKNNHLGTFSDPISAAKRYDEEALKIFGEFARTNF